MNETPTSGPINRSITHQAREAIRSRHSLSTSHMNGVLREGKNDVLQIARRDRRAPFPGRDTGQLVERALAAHVTAAQQHEAVAHARGVGDLVYREKERPPV